MEIINKYSQSYSDRIRDYYDFNELKSLEDVKRIIMFLKQKGYDIKKISVREFGDYEDSPLVKSYLIEKLDEILVDFNDKTIDNYQFKGSYNNNSFSAMISPSNNRLIIDYINEHKDEIDKMMQELDEQEKKTNEEQLTNNSNIFRL